LVICFFVLSASALDVKPPYKVCSTAIAHLKIFDVETNVWPPVSGQTLEVNMTGSVDENVSSGTYEIDVSLDGISVPPITGDISAFKPVPWDQGNISMSFPQDIPGGILPGTTCSLKISAVDQNKDQLFCVSMSFTFGSRTDADGGDMHIMPVSINRPKTHFPVIHSPKNIKSDQMTHVVQRLRQSIAPAAPVPTPSPAPAMHKHHE